MNTGISILKREVVLEAKIPNNLYYKKNKNLINLKTRHLGATISAVNDMMANTAINLNIMPTIIGVQPTDNRWHGHLRAYWDGLTIFVPITGLKLNTSLVFDKDSVKQDFISRENKINEVYTKQVESNPSNEVSYYQQKITNLINLEDEFLGSKDVVVNVENPAEYLNWRYSLIARDVANREIDKNKSKNIRFYISDIAERKRIKDARFKLEKAAMRKYYNIISEESKVKELFVILNTNLGKGINHSNFDELDYQEALSILVKSNPAEFIDVYDDKDTSIKYLITKYIDANILKRLINSQVIVDAQTNDIIGNDMSEAIVFFKQEEKNKLLIAKFKNQFAAANKS